MHMASGLWCRLDCFKNMRNNAAMYTYHMQKQKENVMKQKKSATSTHFM